MRHPKTLDFTLVLMFISNCVSVTSQDNCFQSLVYIFAPGCLTFLTAEAMKHAATLINKLI